MGSRLSGRGDGSRRGSGLVPAAATAPATGAPAAVAGRPKGSGGPAPSGTTKPPKARAASSGPQESPSGGLAVAIASGGTSGGAPSLSSAVAPAVAHPPPAPPVAAHLSSSTGDRVAGADQLGEALPQAPTAEEVWDAFNRLEVTGAARDAYLELQGTLPATPIRMPSPGPGRPLVSTLTSDTAPTSHAPVPVTPARGGSDAPRTPSSVAVFLPDITGERGGSASRGAGGPSGNNAPPSPGHQAPTTPVATPGTASAALAPLSRSVVRGNSGSKLQGAGASTSPAVPIGARLGEPLPHIGPGGEVPLPSGSFASSSATPVLGSAAGGAPGGATPGSAGDPAGLGVPLSGSGVKLPRPGKPKARRVIAFSAFDD